MNCQQAVLEFHDVYGVPVGDRPAKLSMDRLALRLSLIDEEWQELQHAAGIRRAPDGSLEKYKAQDIVEMADALGDIVYVCFGMALEMGVDLNAVFAEIQRANMSKLKDGKPFINLCIKTECSNGYPCDDPDHLIDGNLPQGKVMKGPDYLPPDIKRVLDEQPSLDTL